MKSLLFISPLPQDSQTGGANAVNYHIYKELQHYFNCTYVQINPEEDRLGKWYSQLLRKILKRPGRFNFYSQKRLKAIAKVFDAISGDYDYVFFRGFTPWVLCKPRIPYIAYNDVHFLQFFNNTFTYQHFLKSDIQRICRQEKAWLSNAKMALFESEWGAKQCEKDYQLNSKSLIALGRGGHIPLPSKDVYIGSLNLVVIANNFYQKGGDLVFEAFKQLQPKYKDLQLHVVGGHPGANVIASSGVVYHGYLLKERQEDLSQLTALLSKAFLLMHITREDVNPLVPTEAGYFGCPAVSVQHFAIPELVLNQQTGILLSYLPNPEAIAKAVEGLIEDRETYKMMRQKTWAFNHEHYSWNRIGRRLKALIES